MTLVLLAAMPGISHAQKKVADQTQRQRTYETIAPVVQKERPKVFWYGGEVNLGAGTTYYNFSNVAMDLETIHGVFITKYAYIGAGLQIRYFNATDYFTLDYVDDFGKIQRTDNNYEYCEQGVVLPFFLHFRLNVPVNTRITPYISCSTNLKPIETHKFFMAIHLGMIINNQWNVGLGFDGYQFFHGNDYMSPEIFYTETLPNIKVGYVFGSKGASSSKK